MSICIMLRICEHCGNRYAYNPSIGEFGIICPKCHKAQSELIVVMTNKFGSKI